MTPAEQCRADVEAILPCRFDNLCRPPRHWHACPARWQGGAIARLTPVYERAALSDARHELLGEYDEHNGALRERAERAEAELIVARRNVNHWQKLATYVANEQKLLQEAEADVARLREALAALVRVSAIDKLNAMVRGHEPAWSDAVAALAATERKP